MRRTVILAIIVIVISVAAGCRFEKTYTAADIPELMQMLREGDELKRAEASAALGKLGLDAQEPLVEELSKTEDPKVLEWGIYSLGLIRPPAKRVLSLFIDALDNTNMPVRYEAVRALGTLGADAAEAVPKLIEAYDDTDWRMQYIVAKALGKIHPDSEDAIDILIASLQPDNINIRDTAVNSLEEFGPRAKRAVPSIIATASDTDPPSGYQVVEAVKRIGVSKEHLPQLAEIAGTGNIAARLAAIEAIGLLGGDAVDAVPDLIILLEGKDSRLQEAIINVLYNLGTSAKDALPALRDIAKSSEYSGIRDAAAKAIGKIEYAIGIEERMRKEKEE